MQTHQMSVIRGIVEWIAIFLVTFALMMLVRFFVIEPYVVPTGSMEPTIQIGDTIMGQKVTLELGMDVAPGDIVVFRNPQADSEHDILVKRVIATAGQTVDLEGGQVVVDGEPLDESYTQGESWPLATQAPGADVSFPFTVPEGCIWVMGDNREDSADSRYFGAVPRENLVAVALFRLWPLDRIGPVV